MSFVAGHGHGFDHKGIGVKQQQQKVNGVDSVCWPTLWSIFCQKNKTIIYRFIWSFIVCALESSFFSFIIPQTQLQIHKDKWIARKTENKK